MQVKDAKKKLWRSAVTGTVVTIMTIIAVVLIAVTISAVTTIVVVIAVLCRAGSAPQSFSTASESICAHLS